MPCHSLAKFYCKGVKADTRQPADMSKKVNKDGLASPDRDARTPLASFAEQVRRFTPLLLCCADPRRQEEQPRERRRPPDVCMAGQPLLP